MADENTNLDAKDVKTEEPKGNTYDQRQWDGLLGDKQKAVQRAQELEGKLSSYDSKIQDLEAKIAQKEDDNLGDPDDVATIATLKKAVSKLEKKVDDTEKKLRDEYVREKQNETKTHAEKRIKDSFAKAEKKYTEEKAGKGLTYNEVLEGTKRMVAKNPTYKQLIAADPDPGEMAYKVGLQDPVIAERFEAYKSKLPGGVRQSKDGLSGSASPAGKITYEQMLKMAPGEITKNFDRIKQDVYGWDDKKAKK